MLLEHFGLGESVDEVGCCYFVVWALCFELGFDLGNKPALIEGLVNYFEGDVGPCSDARDYSYSDRS